MAINPDLKNNIMMGPAAAVLDPKAVPGFYSLDNLKALKPEDLNDLKMFNKVAMLVRDIDDDGAGFRAKECLEILISLIDKFTGSADMDEGLLRGYINLLLVLKANFLGLLQDKDVERFLAEQALAAISVELFGFPDMEFLFSLKDKIYDYFRFDIWYLNTDNKKEILRLFIKAVESNNEYLGEDDLKTEAGFVEPSMQNWILDYNQSAHAVLGKRSPFDRAKYLNSSPLVKNLGPNQRRILEKFLEFYDWLRFEAQDLVVSKAQQTLEQIIKTEDKNAKTGLGQKPTPSFAEPASSAQLSPMPLPQAPTPPNVKIAQAMEEIRKPAAPVNIQDILNSKQPREGEIHSAGLKIGDMQFNSPALGATPPQEAQKNNVPDIDKKLEELKKKLNP